MNYIKNKIIPLLFFIIILSITSLVYTILLYFNVVSTDKNTIKITCYIIGLLLFLLLGIISTIKENKNGWLKGLSSSIFILLIALIINLCTHSFYFSLIIKYFSYILTSCIGGIIGINIKKNK